MVDVCTYGVCLCDACTDVSVVLVSAQLMISAAYVRCMMCTVGEARGEGTRRGKKPDNFRAM
jgi:hypothetical protein